MIFWIFYFFLSLMISYSFYRLFSLKFLGFISAVFVFGLLSGVWFISPGSQEVAPIISIFFLENTISESNGYLRLFRPLLISFFSALILGVTFLLLKKFFSKRSIKFKFKY